MIEDFVEVGVVFFEVGVVASVQLIDYGVLGNGRRRLFLRLKGQEGAGVTVGRVETEKTQYNHPD